MHVKLMGYEKRLIHMQGELHCTAVWQMPQASYQYSCLFITYRSKYDDQIVH